IRYISLRFKLDDNRVIFLDCDIYNNTFYFFFSSRRRHTRSKRDWSSDVCSSDLEAMTSTFMTVATKVMKVEVIASGRRTPARRKIGRASCRERVEISVGAGSLKKKRKCLWK